MSLLNLTMDEINYMSRMGRTSKANIDEWVRVKNKNSFSTVYRVRECSRTVDTVTGSTEIVHSEVVSYNKPA